MAFLVAGLFKSTLTSLVLKSKCDASRGAQASASFTQPLRSMSGIG